MRKLIEKIKFRNRFSADVIEIATVTGASEVGAGRAGKDIMWTASIKLIAWKNLKKNEPAITEEVRLEWLVADEEWEKSKDILKKNTIVKLLVRRAEKSMMLVKVLDTAFRDDELEKILLDSLKPVFYNDEILGDFELDKRVKLFHKKISWAGEEGILYFDWNEDKVIMK